MTSPQKKPTLDDVARLAGVAKSTASLVFAGDAAKRNVSPTTREIVLEAAEKLGFELNPHARHLSSGGQRNTIAIFAIGLDLGVGTRKLDYIQLHLTPRGFNVPIITYGYSGGEEVFHQGQLMNNLRLHRPRAIICNSSGLHPETLVLLKRYIDGGGVVVTYDHATDLECDQVIFDRRHSTYTAVRHLLEHGHRRIALVSEGRIPERERLEGLEAALQEFDLPAEACEFLITHREEEGGLELAERFLETKPPITGFAIINDRSAAAFVNALVRAGVKVPDDVSVVSHDDLPTARACVVPLTAMAQPMQEIAAATTSMLLSRLDGVYSGPPRQEIVAGKLQTRESTGPGKLSEP